MTLDLANRSCTPCRRGTPPLTSEQFAPLLAALDGWEVQDDRKLLKTYRFPDWVQAQAFVVAAGAIAEAEFREMTLPQYYKTVAEFAAPLTDPDDPVHRAGLRLEHVETRIVPCPFAADFARHGNAAAFARAYVPTLRSWTESTFQAALSGARPEAERRAIIERY